MKQKVKTKMKDVIKTAYKKGYLNNLYKVFYLNSTKNYFFNSHYHDFYKIVITLDGSADYFIEGKKYQLQKNDILFIQPGDIHKVRYNSSYERLIIYISVSFFEKYNISNDEPLQQIFDTVYKHNTNLLHCKSKEITDLIMALKLNTLSFEFNSELLTRCSLISMLIQLERYIQHEAGAFALNEVYSSNQTIIRVLEYINNNLKNKLTVDIIAEHFYLSPSYLMHLFKKETGLTIISYIQRKKIFLASRFINDGKSLSEACYLSGFKDYTSFYRVFKKYYKVTPATYFKNKK